MNVPRIRRSRLAITVLLGASSVWAGEGEALPAATPYRPTVASAVPLSAPGWLEGEFGIQSTRQDGHRDTLPVLLKYAFSPHWGILLGGDLQVFDRPDEGRSIRGTGDTTLTLKHRFPLASEREAFGFEAGVKFPTAGAAVAAPDNGHDLSFKALYGIDLPVDWHVDINGAATHLGGREAGTGATAFLWAVSAARTLGSAWTVAGEISGTQQRGVASATSVLFALSYALTPQTVADVAVQRGITSGAPDWALMAGVTVLIGRIGR